MNHPTQRPIVVLFVWTMIIGAVMVIFGKLLTASNGG